MASCWPKICAAWAFCSERSLSICHLCTGACAAPVKFDCSPSSQSLEDYSSHCLQLSAHKYRYSLTHMVVDKLNLHHISLIVHAIVISTEHQYLYFHAYNFLLALPIFLSVSIPQSLTMALPSSELCCTLIVHRLMLLVEEVWFEGRRTKKCPLSQLDLLLFLRNCSFSFCCYFSAVLDYPGSPNQLLFQSSLSLLLWR